MRGIILIPALTTIVVNFVADNKSLRQTADVAKVDATFNKYILLARTLLFREHSLNYKLRANKVSYFSGPFHLREQKARSGRWAAPLTAILLMRPFFRIVSGPTLADLCKLRG